MATIQERLLKPDVKEFERLKVRIHNHVCDLKTQRTTVDLSGSAFATLWVEEDLNVEMQGIGSIEYYGRPTITRRAVGMNKLKALGER